MKISATAIKAFLDCPQQYLLRTTIKEEAEQSQDLIVGKLVHTAAETNWKYEKPSIDTVSGTSDYKVLKTDKVSKLKKCLSNFDTGVFDNHYFIFDESDLVEYWFNVPIGNDSLVGRIDRVTCVNILIDWKTGSTVPTENSIKRDIQFLVYDYAFEKEFKKQAVLYLVNLNLNKVILYERDKHIFDYFFNSGIFKILEEIKKSDFPFWGLFNGSCYMCDYKNNCIGGKR